MFIIDPPSRGCTEPCGLVAPPRVLAADGGEPGELLLRSAEELGEYPVTVVHSLREWRGSLPNIL
jgi:hypothetical protein